MPNHSGGKSLEEVHGSVDTSAGKSVWKRILAFFGPAYLVSVGYMDPGNWATDIEGGSRYGYALLWVLVMSNLMAILLQSLAARLGIVYKKDLAQVNRETYPPIINMALYVLAELAIAATDLAEVIGMAIGLHLLFHIPLIYGVGITVLDTFLLLFLQRLGMRKMEAFIIALIAVIFVSFAVEMFLVQPNLSQVLTGIKPSLPDDYALYIAIGIIGATVMPHNLYLHSALVQTRKIGDDDASKKKAIRWNTVDSAVALNLALFVNAAILILAGTVFYHNGYHEIASIESAHELLRPLVGAEVAPILFAVALICAGQSSTITGTLAGQIVMEGYLNLRINPWVRRTLTRLIAITPAVATILIAGEDKMNDLLILSQVVLSIQLAFAIIPLIHAVSDANKMGKFVIKPIVLLLACLVTLVILALNIKMVLTRSMELLNGNSSIWVKGLVGLGLLLFAVLLLFTIFYPLLKRRRLTTLRTVHENFELRATKLEPYRNIGLALDFSKVDAAVLAHAIRSRSEQTKLTLIHIVESANAKVLGSLTDDAETIQDKNQLTRYRDYLVQLGVEEVEIVLGYRNRIREIVRICTEEKVDLLVMGAHGHAGIKDIVYGQTIEAVRHQLTIPVLIVQG
jgi:manganese transport protein